MRSFGDLEVDDRLVWGGIVAVVLGISIVAIWGAPRSPAPGPIDATVSSAPAPIPQLYPTDYAFVLCDAVDKTGMASEPCSVSVSNQSVDVSFDTNAAGASHFCTVIAKVAEDNDAHYGSGWRVRIFSPFSNDHALTTCPLPR